MMIDCNECDGSGTMWLRYSPWSDQLKQHECDWCFGSGEIFDALENEDE